MKIKMLTRARSHYNCADTKTNRHNQRAWIKSIRFLGSRWLLAHPINAPKEQA